MEIRMIPENKKRESHLLRQALTVNNFKLQKNLLDSGEVPPYSQGNRGSSSLTEAKEARWRRQDPVGCCTGDPPRSCDRAGLTLLPPVEFHLLVAV